MTQDTTPDEPVKVGGRKPRGARPEKPRPDFPLFPHLSGQWAKKIRGRVHYFGVWAEPESALALYLDQRDDLHAGRVPRVRRSEGFELRELMNRFTAAKEASVKVGELAPRTLKEYEGTCDFLAKVWGKNRLVVDIRPEDFEDLRQQLAERYGAVALGNAIQRVRSLFKYAYEAGFLPAPVRFGTEFKRPTRKTLRQVRNARGKRMFEPEEFHAACAVAPLQIRAMLLLGVNAGFGGADCGLLPIGAVDLDTGWIDFARPKTGVRRRCRLWPETVAAIREVLAARKPPKDPADAELVFLTKYGKRWYDGTPSNPASKEVKKVLELAGVRRKGLSFYAARHTFETIAGGAKDQPAIDLVMGHARDSDMASQYRERIDDDRLIAVADHVHQWLFKPQQQESQVPQSQPASRSE